MGLIQLSTQHKKEPSRNTTLIFFSSEHTKQALYMKLHPSSLLITLHPQHSLRILSILIIVLREKQGLFL